MKHIYRVNSFYLAMIIVFNCVIAECSNSVFENRVTNHLDFSGLSRFYLSCSE
jgi:hypothetical protein